MSTKGQSSDPDRIFKRSSQKRNDSDELDVFEAARYFSGYSESTDKSYTTCMQKQHNNIITRQERGRISLDLPIRSSYQIHQQPIFEKNDVTSMKDKILNVRHRQPSSPGGRIASFLNSLFHHTSSKKSRSKSKSKSTVQSNDEEESPGGRRRRRRSSISHFLLSSSKSASTNTNSSSKSLYSSSSSGFRTPPPYVNTPTKNYKEFLNYTSHQKQVSFSDDQKRNKDLSWLDEKLKLIETLSEKQRVWADDLRKPGDEKESFSRKFKDENVDDGAESDSSSDLFELQNYDLSCGGLPVYETTNVESIKRGAPMPNI